MDSVSVNKFRDNLKTLVDPMVSDHQPLEVTRRGGDHFVVVVADNWAREQESLFVLQNGNLMRQIAESTLSHAQGTGYVPTAEERDAILGL
jgi:antitoxin YefM